MIRRSKVLLHSVLLCVGFLGLGGIVSCAKYPTYSNKVVDNRPMISFRIPKNSNAASYAIFIDGQTKGSASEYLAGIAGLRVTSGTHVVRVEKAGIEVYNSKLYVGDGSVKEISLP